VHGSDEAKIVGFLGARTKAARNAQPSDRSSGGDLGARLRVVIRGGLRRGPVLGSAISGGAWNPVKHILDGHK